MSITKTRTKAVAVTVYAIFVGAFFAMTPFASAAAPKKCEAGLDKDNCDLTNRLVEAINILSIVVGVVIVAMIIWGGIQYTMSRDDPQHTAAAKNHIVQALIALVFYIFSIAFLNYLVPGGVFS